jgi:hypothetical protein
MPKTLFLAGFLIALLRSAGGDASRVATFHSSTNGFRVLARTREITTVVLERTSTESCFLRQMLPAFEEIRRASLPIPDGGGTSYMVAPEMFARAISSAVGSAAEKEVALRIRMDVPQECGRSVNCSATIALQGERCGVQRSMDLSTSHTLSASLTTRPVADWTWCGELLAPDLSCDAHSADAAMDAILGALDFLILAFSTTAPAGAPRGAAEFRVRSIDVLLDGACTSRCEKLCFSNMASAFLAGLRSSGSGAGCSSRPVAVDPDGGP